MCGMPTRLLIADDHRLILRALIACPRRHDDIEIVGRGATGSQVLPLLHQQEPECLPARRAHAGDGRAHLRRADPEERDRRPRRDALGRQRAEHGRKPSPAAPTPTSRSRSTVELADALRRVHRGEKFQLGLAGALASDEAGLTEREKSILQAGGPRALRTRRSRGAWITEQTVKFHLTNIYRKLGVSSRTEAARYALSRGLAAA